MTLQDTDSSSRLAQYIRRKAPYSVVERGIAAAEINNNTGIAGIAGWIGQSSVADSKSVLIMPVRVTTGGGGLDPANDWATR